MEYAFAAMVGWCGTPWPGWWRGPHKPQPDPWWWIIHLVGAAAGIGALIVFKPILGDAGFVGTTLASFFGGAFAGSVVGAIMPGKAQVGA